MCSVMEQVHKCSAMKEMAFSKNSRQEGMCVCFPLDVTEKTTLRKKHSIISSIDFFPSVFLRKNAAIRLKMATLPRECNHLYS